MLYEVRHYCKKKINESRQKIVKQRWCILFCFCIMTNCTRDRFNIVCKDNIGKILVINKLEKNPQTEIQIVFFVVCLVNVMKYSFND